MLSEIRVDLGLRSYPIYIGEGLLAGLGGRCRELGLGRAALVVSDENVSRHYGEAALESLRKEGITANLATVPSGESSKDERHLFGLYENALDARLDRSGFIVALGGGVVGDLAGFAAATYLRGIRFVQVPTSLMAMVDSSVGGKTGINLPRGKNLVGAFHQPAFVLADTEALTTLPRREFVSGLAEAVKHGVIRDADFFGWMEANREALRMAQPDALAHLVRRCCEIKAEVVGADEREGGVRAILNFGHTVGHAIEQVTGYGTWLHGEAVAMGLAYAARLSTLERGFPAAEADRVTSLLKNLGLPVSAPSCEWAEIRAAMDVDKKASGAAPRFVLAEDMGAVTHGCAVKESMLESAWRKVQEP